MKSDDNSNTNIEPLKPNFPETAEAQSKDRERHSGDGKTLRSISTLRALMEDTENLKTQHPVSKIRPKKEAPLKEVQISADFEHNNKTVTQTNGHEKMTTSDGRTNDIDGVEEEKDSSLHESIVRLKAVRSRVQALIDEKDNLKPQNSAPMTHQTQEGSLKDAHVPIDFEHRNNTGKTQTHERSILTKRDDKDHDDEVKDTPHHKSITKLQEVRNEIPNSNQTKDQSRKARPKLQEVRNEIPNSNHTKDQSRKVRFLDNLSSIVWKHKSGVHDNIQSKQKAWERRRLVLAETKLLYYDLTGKDIAESMGAIGGSVQTGPKVYGTYKENKATGLRGMLNLRPGSQVVPVTSFKNEIESELRAPTAFGMEVLVGGKKWTFCFDDVEQQAQWISSLNNVVNGMNNLTEKEQQPKSIQERKSVRQNQTKTATINSVENNSSIRTKSEQISISTAVEKTHNEERPKTPPEHAYKKEMNKNRNTKPTGNKEKQQQPKSVQETKLVGQTRTKTATINSVENYSLIATMSEQKSEQISTSSAVEKTHNDARPKIPPQHAFKKEIDKNRDTKPSGINNVDNHTSATTICEQKNEQNGISSVTGNTHDDISLKTHPQHCFQEEISEALNPITIKNISVDNYSSATTISGQDNQSGIMTFVSEKTYDNGHCESPSQQSFKEDNHTIPHSSNFGMNVLSEKSISRTAEQKQLMLSRESQSRFLQGKAQLRNKNFKEAKAAFEKALESRIILFGPNDPEVAEVYEALGDVAIGECDSKRAQKNYEQSIDIIKKCKCQLDSYIIKNKIIN